MKKGVFPGLENLMLPWIGKTMKHIDLFLSARMAEKGVNLNRQQIILLKTLFHDGPQTQHNLACLTDRDKASLTRLLATMEKKNLVARITSPTDKRVNMVHLTKHGEKVLEETMPVLMESIQIMQNNIDEDDQNAVIRTMERIQENIENHMNSCNNN